MQINVIGVTSPLAKIGYLPLVTSRHLLGDPPPSPSGVTSFMDDHKLLNPGPCLYQVMTNCDFQLVGEEFSRKPYALAVQQGSPLKDQLNDAYVL